MAVNILNNDFENQDYRNLQNVNQDNMNNLSQNKDMQLASYFDNYTLYPSGRSDNVQVGSICFGIGSIAPVSYLPVNFGQSGSSLTFTLYPGVIRFLDKSLSYASSSYSENQSIRAYYEAGGGDGEGTSIDVTFTISGTPEINTKYYAIAVLNSVNTDAYTNTLTCTISTTLIDYATLSINQLSDNPTYVALFYVYTTDGENYGVGSDEKCANNYNILPAATVPQNGYLIYSEFIPNTTTINLVGSIGFSDTPTATAVYRPYSNGVTKFVITLTGTVYITESQFTTLAVLELYNLTNTLRDNLTNVSLSFTTNSLFKYSINISYDGGIAWFASASPNFFMTDSDNIPSASCQISPSLSTASNLTSIPNYYIVNASNPYFGISLGGIVNGNTDIYLTITALIEMELTNNP